MNEAQALVDHQEIDRFEKALHAYLNEEMDGDRFQSIRLQQGVYGQRQEGVNMVRVKLPGGSFTPEQAEAIADVLDEYSQHDQAHITTRQDIQLHHVPLSETPAALKRLARVGLTTREACNNTVRNVTACPLAGVCPREHVDIGVHMQAAVRHFLRHPLTQHLPRKFKISFSGCEADCAQGMMHDVGVVAVDRDGRFGFKVVAGGGLGHKPHEAITVEEFIEEPELLASIEALISLHNRYSDRKKRAKSRLKFLVDRFGREGFIEKYREELPRTRTALADVPSPRGEWSAGTPGEACGTGAPRAVFAQRQAMLYVFPISVSIGDLTAPQLRGIARIMRSEGLTDIRTTQDQNLMLLNVPEGRIEAIRGALSELDLGKPVAGDNVVACPGTSTCRLGITSSKAIGAKLNGSTADLRVRASGCHNGCAQPETGDIGIYGEGKRLHGKLIPHYQTYIGGDGSGDGGLGFKGPTIPTARIETAVTRMQQSYIEQRCEDESFFQWSRRQGKAYFVDLLSDLARVAPEDIPQVQYDHGDEAAFRVLQLGGGECAGAAQETVAANFAEAANERNYRNAFLLQRKYDEAIECSGEIARRVGQSLLFVAGQKAVDDMQEIATLVKESFPDDPGLGGELAGFDRTLSRLKDAFDQTAFSSLAQEMDRWTARAAQACQHIDSQLDLSASIPAIAPAGKGKESAQVIDLTSYGCPLHYIKARNELRKHPEGEVIEFLFVAGEPAEQVSSSLESDGYRILDMVDQGDTTRIRVKKTG